MAEEQQNSGNSNGENIIPPEEVAKFLPETVEEGNSFLPQYYLYNYNRVLGHCSLVI